MATHGRPRPARDQRVVVYLTSDDSDMIDSLAISSGASRSTITYQLLRQALADLAQAEAA